MSYREFESYSEGYRDLIDLWQDILTVLQCNLINVHVPRGKSKATPKKLRKGFGTRRGDKAAPAPASTGDEIRERARRAIAERQSREYWDSPEGRRVDELLRR